jgi:hypothetical protein
MTFLGNPNDTCSCSFPHSMIRNGIMFALKCQFWSCCVCDHTLIITENIRWSLDWDSKHAQFISQTFDQLYCNMDSNKLRAKTGSFHCILTFQKQDHGSVAENDNACMRLSGNSVTSVICISEPRHNNSFTSWCRSICRYGFNCIWIKGRPIHWCKSISINMR